EKCFREGDADLSGVKRRHGAVAAYDTVGRFSGAAITGFAGKRNEARSLGWKGRNRRHHIPVSLMDGEGRTHDSRRGAPLQPMRTAGTPRPRFEKCVTAGLLARRSLLLPAFPVPWHQWQIRQKLAAYSCGGSAGIPSGHRLPS